MLASPEPLILAVIDQFLNTLKGTNSVYFLGAGASSPIMPMADQLGVLALEQGLALGCFPVDRVILDPVAEHIVGRAKQKLKLFPPWDDGLALRAELSERISGSAVQAAAIGLLHSGTPTQCPQYDVLQCAARPATILNFNNDGLASTFCTKHVVLNMHGTSLDPHQRQVLGWSRYIDNLQMFPELQAPIIPGLLLPQPEPYDIIYSTPYLAARSLLSRAKRIALIGYSFGSMDDRVAYRLLIKTVERTRAPIVVVGPDVKNLVMRLREDVNGVLIVGLEMLWNVLTEALITASTRRFHKSCNVDRWCSRCIAYDYERILDRG